MNWEERIVGLIDSILDIFNVIRRYVDDALHIFEKLKAFILDLIKAIKDKLDHYIVKELEVLDEEHFFI